VGLSDANSSALFIDFDGTLVEIADTPDAVVVSPSLVPTLAELRSRLKGALALISGRSLAAIDGFFQPEVFDAAGLHGAEYRLAGERWHSRDALDPALRAAVRKLEQAVASEPGILLEDKDISVAVHWRLAPHAAEQAMGAVAAAVEALQPAYRIQHGKAVAEIVPAGANKGQVIQTFMASAPFSRRRPVFIGDDLTDEHGFAAVNALGGLSIKVGGGPTQAQAMVESPAELGLCLAGWATGKAVTLQQVGA